MEAGADAFQSLGVPLFDSVNYNLKKQRLKKKGKRKSKLLKL